MSPRGARTRNGGWWIVACLALVSPRAAASSGVSLSGFAGAGYLLTSADMPSGWASRSNVSLTAGAAVSGGIIRPQLLSWGGNFVYTYVGQVEHRGASSADHAVGFGARVSILSGFPVSGSLYANRSQRNLDQLTPRRSTGTSVTTEFGGSASLNVPDYPRIGARLGRTLTETRAGGLRSFSGMTSLGASISQQLRLLDYAGSYDTNWSNGTYVDRQYGSHNVNLHSSARLAKSVQFTVAEQYFVRLPTIEAPTNPRLETNAVSATLNWRQSQRLTANLGYSNLQSSFFAPGAIDVVQSSHALTEGLSWEWRKGLVVTQNLSAQFANSRSGTQTFEGKRQDAGAGLSWTRPTSWGGGALGLGASVGLAETLAGVVTPTWGANLNGQLSLRIGRLNSSGVYSLGYADGGIPLFGRSFNQSLRLEATFVPAFYWRLRAVVSGSGFRRDDAIVRTALRRQLQALAELGYRQHRLELFGSYGDGLSESLANPVFADGLFLPAPWNSQTTDLGASLSTSFDRGRLQLRATGRTTETTSFGRVSREVAFYFTAAYPIGKFNLSASDSLTLGTAGAVWYRNNTLMLSVSRNVDWSF